MPMRVLLIATGDIAIPTLEFLLKSPDHKLVGLVTQPDRPAGRAQTLRPPPVKCLASPRVPVLQPERIRTPDAVASVAALRPDVIVTMAYGQILPRAVLDIPPVACLNLHASLLPRHRGAAPVQAAIEAGDPRTGITVMHMAEGLDTGDILLAREIPIRRRETGGSLHDRLAALAPGALKETLALLAAGGARRTVQDDSLATYARKLTREHGRIHWTADHGVVERKIRALDPWPGAFTLLPPVQGHPPRKLKIHTAIPHRRASGAPGSVLRTDSRGLLVACGSGAVLLREVQLEGRSRMHTREFLMGHAMEPGSILG